MIRRDILENQVNIAYLSIGSNLGDRLRNINTTKFKLESKKTKIIQCSSNYESLSWPNSKNPKFINAVIRIKTFLKPGQLLIQCNKIENDLGRTRKLKNEPRICDIDIIDFNNKVFNSTKKNYLILPHPEAVKRNFVLLPLYEISKQWRHPKSKVYISELINLLNVNDLSTIKQL